MARKYNTGVNSNVLICDRCGDMTEDGSQSSLKWYKKQINDNNVFTLCYCPKCASHHILTLIELIKDENPEMRFPLILNMLGLQDDINHHNDVYLLKMVESKYVNFKKLQIK